MAPEKNDSDNVEDSGASTQAPDFETSESTIELDVESPELEILDEPDHVASVVQAIPTEQDPSSQVLLVDPSEESEEIEELEDFEELDDFELVEEVQASPPPLPPRTPKDAVSQIAEIEAQESLETEAVPTGSDSAVELELTTLAVDSVSVLDELLQGREALDWNKRAKQLTAELELAETNTRIGELSYELGELYLRRLDDEASAVKSYGRALQADPSLRANLWAIRKIFYRRELWPNLVKLIGAELSFAGNQEQRIDLLVERGSVLLYHLEELEAAQASFEEALSLDESNSHCLIAMERIARQSSNQELLWRTLASLAGASSAPERKVAFLVELARELRLSRTESEEALRLLNEATQLGVCHDLVAREREALARTCENPSAFAASLERRVATLVDECGGEAELSDDAKARIVAWRRHQAQLLIDSGDSEGAWHYLQEAHSLSPDDELVLVDLTELADALGRYEEMAELAAARESGESDPARALGLALRRASALAKAGKTDEAHELISARAVAYPGYLPLVVPRQLHLVKQEDWVALAGLQLETGQAFAEGSVFGPGAAIKANPSAAAHSHLAAGDILRFGAQDFEGAETNYRTACKLCPELATATEALVSLLIARRKFSAAAQLLEQLAEHPDHSFHSPALYRLAMVYLFLDQRNDELAVCRRLLALHPGQAPLRQRILEVLRELCLYAELATALELEADACDEPIQADRYRVEAGRLYLDYLEQPAKAVLALTGGARTWPEDTVIQEYLHCALQRSEDWSQLIEFLLAQMESGLESLVTEDLAREALYIATDRLRDSPEATRLALLFVERWPENTHLLLDALACFDALTHQAGQLLALEALSQTTAPALRNYALLRLGSLQERCDEALRAEESFAATEGGARLVGALMHHSLVAAQADSTITIEALGSLASLVEDPASKSSLLEQIGWKYLAAQEDERASQVFADCQESPATAFAENLRAAKSREHGLQAEGLVTLAAATNNEDARSSLLFRAAWLAEVSGDLQSAEARRHESRSASPEDAGLAILAADRLAPLALEHETSQAELASRAELCRMRAALAEPGAAQVDWLLEQADALERAGLLQEAGQSVALVLDEHPNHIRGLQALRRICLRGGDRKNLAHTSLTLATQLGHAEGRLELLREAATILDQELNDDEAAILAYRLIVELEPGAPEYDRLISVLQRQDDVRGLYQCYTARLNHLDVQGDQSARIEILFQRARLRTGIGDMRGASRDLKTLVRIDPLHEGALLELARLLERAGEAEQAVEHYQLFLSVATDADRRSSAELSLSYLMVDTLDDLDGAIAQLQEVVEQAEDDLELKERLITLLLQGKRGEHAIALIESMSATRNTNGERARDELRIAAIQRDGSQEEAAVASLVRGRAHDPLNMDILRDLIQLVGGDESKHAKLLDDALCDLRQAISDAPLEAGLYERLVTLARWREDVDLLYQSLQALKAAGSLSAKQEKALTQLSKTAREEGVVVTEPQWQEATAPSSSPSFNNSLWACIGPAVSEVMGASPAALGFERHQRSKGKNIDKLYPAVAKMIQAIGVQEIEVFVSDSSASVARASSAAAPTLCLGTGIVRASTSAQRFALARAIAYAKAGTGTAAELEPTQLILLFCAAAQLAEVSTSFIWAADIDPGAVDLATSALGKALGRKARKELVQMAEGFAELENPITWQHSLRSGASQLALLLCGDLSGAFDVLDVGHGGRPLHKNPIAPELMAWSVGHPCLSLKKRLGLSVKEGL